MDNVSEDEDDADAENEVSEAGNKYALFFYPSTLILQRNISFLLRRQRVGFHVY